MTNEVVNAINEVHSWAETVDNSIQAIAFVALILGTVWIMFKYSD